MSFFNCIFNLLAKKKKESPDNFNFGSWDDVKTLVKFLGLLNANNSESTESLSPQTLSVIKSACQYLKSTSHFQFCNGLLHRLSEL